MVVNVHLHGLYTDGPGPLAKGGQRTDNGHQSADPTLVKEVPSKSWADLCGVKHIKRDTFFPFPGRGCPRLLPEASDRASESSFPPR